MADLPNPLRRGQILLVQLDPIAGSEQGGQRPVVVLSPERINRNSPVLIVASLSTRKTDRVFAFETLIEAGEAGLAQRSKIMFMQTRSIDKSRAVGALGVVSDATLERMDAALKIAVGLDKI